MKAIEAIERKLTTSKTAAMAAVSALSLTLVLSVAHFVGATVTEAHKLSLTGGSVELDKLIDFEESKLSPIKTEQTKEQAETMVSETLDEAVDTLKERIAEQEREAEEARIRAIENATPQEVKDAIEMFGEQSIFVIGDAELTGDVAELAVQRIVRASTRLRDGQWTLRQSFSGSADMLKKCQVLFAGLNRFVRARDVFVSGDGSLVKLYFGISNWGGTVVGHGEAYYYPDTGIIEVINIEGGE